MRKLMLISGDLFVRSFIETGAFDEIDDDETYFVAAEGMRQTEKLESHPRFRGFVPVPKEREDAYFAMRLLMMAAYRHRSKTCRIKSKDAGRLTKLILRTQALPGLRQWTVKRILKPIGQNEALRAVFEDLKPDIVIAPASGTDTLALDGVRLCDELGIPSLLLVNGWDNISSKSTYSVAPKYLGVWGEQSVGHAEKIHRIPRERVFPIGVPTFDHYFDFDAAASEPPYPFRYALLAGSALPFDELTPLKLLEEQIERSGRDDLKIVYRPHPWRFPRVVDDVFHEQEFKHVVLDRQVRDQYLATIAAKSQNNPASFLPSLDYYPSLIGNAELVITPLSTMLVEAGIFDRRVLVIAYDDKIHPVPPSTVFHFDHFRGTESVDGFELCWSVNTLATMFERMLELPPIERHGVRNQLRQWLFFDERSYSERLRDLVDEIGRREGLPTAINGEAAA